MADQSTPDPQPQAAGWYTMIGDCFLVYIPGQQAVLSSYASVASMQDEGAEIIDTLQFIPFRRNASGKIEEVDRAF